MNYKGINNQISFACLLALVTLCPAAIHKPPREDCVLGADNFHECTPARQLLTSAKTKAPCAKSDMQCWNKLVKDYTNEVRKQHGVNNLLKLGPRRQQTNAKKHAERLSKWGFLKHQILSQVTKEVKCNRWIGGENLAYNYDNGDIARTCVNQWIKSKGHFDNLIREWFKEVTFGYHFDNDGKVYCVQTFGLFYPKGTFGPANTKDCEPVA